MDHWEQQGHQVLNERRKNKLTEKVTWYNKAVCKKLNSQSFRDYFKTGRKKGYYLMCSVDTYEKEHVSMPDDASSGSGRPIPSTSSKE